MEQTTGIATTCPECDATITFDLDPIPGEVTTCAGCRTELEVLGVDPLRVTPAEIEEDWGE